MAYDLAGAVTSEATLAAAARLAEEVLASRAEAADRAFAPEAETFRALLDGGFAGLIVAPEFGGLGADDATCHAVSEVLGGACGVTHFTLHQHWSACRFIQQGNNEPLKRRALPKLASGAWLTGVGFSHLRRSGPPVVRAVEIPDGWRLSGVIPWFSGWGLYRYGVLAAKLPDLRELFVFTSVTEPTVVASLPMALCAMQGSATVTLTLDQHFVSREQTCFIGEVDWLRKRDRVNLVQHAYNPLIVAAASVRLLRRIAEQRANATIARTADALGAELADLRERVDFWACDESTTRTDYFEGAMATRTGAITLAVRAAHAAVVASAGAANALSHPAQRRFREAMFYSIQGQTQDVMEATLRTIAKSTHLG